jgi:RND family efflux transporter MFP subunit
LFQFFRTHPLGARYAAAPSAALAAALMVTAACSTEQQTPPAPPPVAVTAITLTAEPVPNIIELPGRIEAVRRAEVRARTNGIIERRLYIEGTDVREGAPLFRIDPRDLEAQVQQGRAALQRAVAARRNAAQIVERYQPLVSERAVSAQEYDQAQSDLAQAEASVADARATLSRSQLELSYTTVRAPIAGRIGRAQVTEGALVSATEATLLTTVEQLNPVYAVFTQSSARVQDIAQRARSGEIVLPDLSRVEVRLILENGAQYGPVGHLNFADLTVDPSTGSQVLRADFPNIERILLPGTFVRGRIFAGTTTDGIAVPQAAVQIASEEASVTIIASDGTARRRPVVLGGLVDGKWVIRSGLKHGERVIVTGWQKAQPGQKVRVQPARNGRAAAAPAQSAPKR